MPAPDGGLGLGFGIIFSSLTTKYRDLTFLIQFGVQLAMYATPIIYPMSTLSEKYQRVLWWNPISHIIEAFKYGFLGSGQASLSGMAYATAFTLIALALGVIIFNKTNRRLWIPSDDGNARHELRVARHELRVAKKVRVFPRRSSFATRFLIQTP